MKLTNDPGETRPQDDTRDRIARAIDRIFAAVADHQTQRAAAQIQLPDLV